MCWPTYFVHMKGTSNDNAKERSKYNYHTSCSQCGKEFTSENAKTNHVAAHVIGYLCWCIPCFGVKTLKTTCKTCNNTNNAETEEGRGFWSIYADKNPNMGWVCCAPSCVNYEEI